MEKYGTVPDKFTREWWDHIWYYYKWHIISVLGLIFIFTVTGVQCASRINYDARICYLGNEYYSDESQLAVMCGELGNVVVDVNGNEKNQVEFYQLTIAKEGTQNALTEYNSAMLTKAAMEFQTGESYLFLLSQQELDRMTKRESDERVFVNPREYIEGEIDESTLVMQGEIACAINIEGNAFLQKYNLTKEPVFLAVRNMRSRDMEDKEQLEKYDNAVKLANYILMNK